MKGEQKPGLKLARGILRVVLGIGLLAGILIAPLPAQISMGRSGFASVPPAKKQTTAPAKSAGGSVADKRLAEAIQNLTPKDRKKLDKALKRLTPEQRAKAIDTMKRQFAPASHATRIAPGK
jgi:hypothetical protein